MEIRPFRRWPRAGLLAGAILAGIGYYRYRTRTESAASESPAITERHATAFLVRRRVDPDRLEAVRDHVATSFAGTDPEPLLGLEGASTASLFVDTGEDPELVWYVEVPRSVTADWVDPEARVASAFPVDHDAIGDAEVGVDRELLVHAANPERPRTTAAAGSGPLLAVGPAVEDGVDVDLVRLRLRPGLPERLADRFAGLSRRVAAGELDLGPIEEWSAEMLDAEEMYTESIFLERRADGYVLVGYMETADMQAVYDAYYDTWNPVARASEVLLGRVLEDPSRILEYPLGTDVELLAHAVDPDRPRRPEEC